MTDSATIRPDPAALKALTHPDRLRMLGILRIEGPQTSTSLAARLSLNSGATSYHLRRLAGAGFIEEAAELGTGRDRWWRSAHEVTTIDDTAPEGSEAAETMGAYLATIVARHVEVVMAAQMRHAGLPVEWRQASTASDGTFWLTAPEADALSRRLEGELSRMRAETPPITGSGAEGQRRFTVQIHAFPHPADEP